jgi:peptide/nickel transport system ATP-binding protein
MREETLLELKNVTKIFNIGGSYGRGKIKAVDNVSFSIPMKPNITVLVGESGSGKSTIVRMILGLIKPTSGQIFYKGISLRDILKRKDSLKEYRREVQAIFQDPYDIYNPFYRVDRVLETTIKKFNLASSKDEIKTMMHETLEKIGLRPIDILGRYPHQLSGGERQRIMLARILLIKPKLIVADEPVSMIDASLRALFLDYLLKFRDDLGIPCIYVTHDFNIAYYVAERGLVLNSGKIVEEGPIEDLIKDPIHPYTKTLIHSIPNPDPKSRKKLKLETLVTSIKEARPERGCVYQNKCPFVMPVCSKETPPMVEVKENHEVACFRVIHKKI